MAFPPWDPYRALNIIGKDDQDMLCVGREVALWNARCRCQVTKENVAEIHSLFKEMAAEPPEEAAPKLRQLAQLALCEQYHQDQKVEVVAQWKKLIAASSEDYEAGQQLRSENQRLMDFLEEERRERVRLEALVSKKDDSDTASSNGSIDSDLFKGELAIELEDLKAKLHTALLDAGRHEKNFQVAEATRKALAARVEYLEAMYAKRDREAENLKLLLEEQKEDQAILLEEERQVALNARRQLQQHREELQKTQAEQATLIKTLQAELREKSRVLDQRLMEVKEKTALCSVLARKIEDSDYELSSEREAAEELKKGIEESASTQLNLSSTIADLEAKLASEQEKISKLQNDVEAAHQAETEAAKELENFRSKFLEEQSTLQTELDRAVKRRTELLEEVESMRSSAHRSTIKIEHDLETAMKEQETLEAERNSLQSQLFSERHGSVRYTRDLEEAKAAQNVLVEEIELLRSQLSSEREGRITLEEAMTSIKIEKHKIGLELQEQREAAQKQKETAEKLEALLTATKEQEVYLTAQLASVQASLKHAQAEQTRSMSQVEALMALRPLHVKVMDLARHISSQSPSGLLNEVKANLSPLAFRTKRWADSTWNSIAGWYRRPRAQPEDLEAGRSGTSSGQ